MGSRLIPPLARTPSRESGIALLLVIFTITLLSIMGIALTNSTHIGSQLHRSFVDRFRAELLLKSALNVGLELIAQAPPEPDPPKDSWGLFTSGKTVPASVLGIEDPRLEIGLEITGENSRIPIMRILPIPGNTRDRDWRDILARLFSGLGFDNDGETDHTGLFGDRTFSSKEMVGNLIDYLDDDPTSFSEGEFKGLEQDLPKDYFPEKGRGPNAGGGGLTLDELAMIPGFTPLRLKAISPLITPLASIISVNINLASPAVIAAIDPNMTPEKAQAIFDFAHGSEGPFGPFNAAGEGVLSSNFPNYQSLKASGIIDDKSTDLRVTAKVQFSDRRYFARATVRRGGLQEPPEVTSREFFG